MAYGGIQVNKDGAGDIFAVTSLSEEGFERTLGGGWLLRVGVEAAISLEAMLEEIAKENGQRGVVSQRAASLTVPRRYFPAGYQPGRCECGRPIGSR